MRVRIVSYENINAWILGKFARRLYENLKTEGVDVDIDSKPDKTADINHHIIYMGYQVASACNIDTLMITHIDDIRKLKLLKEQLKFAKAGICMSKSVMTELHSAGLPDNKLCYINPAYDNVFQVRKMVIGITSKVQPDGCKREWLVERLFDNISPKFFALSIMGAGWDKIVKNIREKGFTVNYINEFEYSKYIELIPTFDYYLYTGQDEGSMGFIDALASGVKTVVTPQGFHLDAPLGITHSFNDQDELISIFKKLEDEKKELVKAVDTWTWKDYALKHIELWKYLLDSNKTSALRSDYTDGINSLLNEKGTLSTQRKNIVKRKMIRGYLRRVLFKAKKIKNISLVKQKIKNKFFKRRK